MSILKLVITITVVLATSLFIPPVQSKVGNVVANAAKANTSTIQSTNTTAQTKTNADVRTNVDTNTSENTDRNAESDKVAADLAASYKVSTADILQLHKSGWGYGEIDLLYALAQASGKSAADIKAMRDAGLGWGEIAARLHLSLGKVRPHLGALVSGHGQGGQ
ncbi:MAG: hypothetical protein KGJ80_08040 [Chloroflexota bacterium]|nr:hypothetical protein [Chloroflexota bacterium]